ncbi:MAG TPA: cytochrome c [Chthoniobacteraceae bacterium]|jgi:mono/diheme cytochrome c family protein|nr:cytochrome c [Chthoniobacteraceae bacterium]
MKSLLVFAALASAAQAAPLITLPPETATLKPGAGAEVATGQCLVCHSAQYISTQPVMPRAFWKASVEKMQKKYGAPIPDDQVALLVEYLVHTYGSEKPK